MRNHNSTYRHTRTKPAHHFADFLTPTRLTKVAPSSSALSPTPPAFAVACIEKWWRTEGRKRYPDADCLADSGSSNGYNAARLKVQPAAPGNTGVAGRADERRVPGSWSPGLPKRPARKRNCSNRSDLLAIDWGGCAGRGRTARVPQALRPPAGQDHGGRTEGPARPPAAIHEPDGGRHAGGLGPTS